jgi:hypothetical protein
MMPSAIAILVCLVVILALPILALKGQGTYRGEDVAPTTVVFDHVHTSCLMRPSSGFPREAAQRVVAARSTAGISRAGARSYKGEAALLFPALPPGASGLAPKRALLSPGATRNG